MSMVSVTLLMFSLSAFICTILFASMTNGCLYPVFNLSNDSGHVGCSNAGSRFSCLPPEVNNISQLTINLEVCFGMGDFLPEGIFNAGNRITGLRVYAPAGSGIRTFKNGTFENLCGLEELHLEGFESVRVLESDVFRPLVGLRSLTLVAFGADYLTYLDLGVALTQLSGSPLERIAFNGIHSNSNNERELNLDELFQMSDVRIKSLEFVNNDINIVRGRLSTFLPHLTSITFSAYRVYAYAVFNFAIDSLVLLEDLESLQFAFVDRKSGTGDVVCRWPPKPEAIWIKCMMDIPILDYYLNLRSSDDCYFDSSAVIDRRLRSITVHGMDFFRGERLTDLCVEEGNSLEYLDLSESKIAALEGTVHGLQKLRYLSLRDVGLTHLSDSLFREMPSIEVLILSGNDLETPVRENVNGNLFVNLTLRTLDLSNCGLNVIPQTIFSSLNALQFLNLSQNKIETFQVKLPPSGNLSLLNLSDNSIRFLTSEMISELESLQNSDDNRPKLTIDLSRNPLSCLCNATEFIAWLKSTKKVSFESIEEYTCLHPNGSKVSVNSQNMTELMSDCQYLSELPITCPCAGLDYKRLKRLSLSLTDVYCTYDGKRRSYSYLVANVKQSIEEYWWCKSVIENLIFKSPKFIVPVIIGFLLLVLLGFALIVIYKRRYIPKDVAKMMQCVNLRPYIMHLIQYLSNHPANIPENYEFDVFVYFQADDGPWVRGALLENLQHLKVITPDNFRIGAAMADAILDGCRKSRVVVLVLSSSFKRDDWCREVTLRSYTSHPGSVIPVVINNTDLSDFEDDPLFSNLIATHCPIDLSSADSFIWNEFTSRVDNNIRQSSNSS